MFPRPAVPPAVPDPDIVASISKDEAQAGVGQVGDPVASFQHQAMLQEDHSLWSWRKKRRNNFLWSPAKLIIHIPVLLWQHPPGKGHQRRDMATSVLGLSGEVFLKKARAEIGNLGFSYTFFLHMYVCVHTCFPGEGHTAKNWELTPLPQ